MHISVENLEFLPTKIETASLSNAIELRNLIGGDITIAIGDDTTTFDEVSVVDFALVLAGAIVGYLSNGSDRIAFFSPDHHDIYEIRTTGGYGLTCEVLKNGKLLSDQESLLEIINSMRAFIGETKPLIEQRYGHIKFIWDVLTVPVY